MTRLTCPENGVFDVPSHVADAVMHVDEFDSKRNAPHEASSLQDFAHASADEAPVSSVHDQCMFACVPSAVLPGQEFFW